MATKPRTVSLDIETAKALQADLYESLGRLHRQHAELGCTIDCQHRKLKQLETACGLDPMPQPAFGQK